MNIKIKLISRVRYLCPSTSGHTVMAAIKLSVVFSLLAVILYFIWQYVQGPMCQSNARIDGKTIIVTGGNSGIGKETVRDLVSRGGKVIVACRNMVKCKTSVEDIQKEEKVDGSRVYPMQLDLSSSQSIREFVANFEKRESELHILVNNAGVMLTPYSKTEDGLEIQIGVNHFGHFLLTHLLLEILKKSSPSRIINVSSIAHQFGDINLEDINYETREYSSWKAYSDSKQANILFTRQLAKELKGTGVTAYSLHPGGIRTGLQDHLFGSHTYILDIFHILSYPFWKDIVHGAQTTVCCAVDEQLSQVSGKYYSDCAEKEPAIMVQDDELAQKLWDYSLKTFGLHKQDQTTQT